MTNKHKNAEFGSVKDMETLFLLKREFDLGKWIENFVRESNMIEGIERLPTDREDIATESFLELTEITIDDLKEFVSVFQPDALIRDKANLNVVVGSHRPPRGGPSVVEDLEELLKRVNLDSISPYLAHKSYESLHPFMDGNGRSGRVLWLWQMLRNKEKLAPMGFLQSYYFASLEKGRNE